MRGLVQKLGAMLGNRWIMVIEPKANYRASIKQFLTNLKVKKVKYVGSVEDAKREMLTLKVGLFICEWGLDNTNGIQFCRTLRRDKIYRNTPFLLMSVENLKKDVMLATEAHIDAYLLKPFSYEDFCAHIEMLVRASTAPTPVGQILDEAEGHLFAGRFDEAEVLLLQVINSSPSARAYSALAKARQHKGDLQAAARHARAAIAANGEYLEAYRVMLDIAEALGEAPTVLQTAMVLNRLSPDNPRYCLILAKHFLEANNLDSAEKLFRRAIALSPKMADAYRGLGTLHMVQEEYEQAAKNFHKALDLEQGDISTLNSLGLAYVRMGQVKEGIQRYLIALKFDPQDGRVLFNLGAAHEKAGELVKAKQYYQLALTSLPDFDKAKRGIKRLNELKGGALPSPADLDDEEWQSPSGGPPLKKSG